MKKLWTILFVLLAGSAFAKDGFEGRPQVCGDMKPGPRLDECRAWISAVTRPDLPGASCCADADAYMADNFKVLKDGTLIAIITADYPDDPNITRGQEIVIPQEKVIHVPEQVGGNTSGHGVLFFHGSLGVLCFTFPPLT